MGAFHSFFPLWGERKMKININNCSDGTKLEKAIKNNSRIKGKLIEV